MAKRQTQPSAVVVVGSSNTDLVVQSSKLPEPGMTVLGGEFQVIPGGKGANQAVASAYAGAPVSFVANIGRDDFGDAALQRFEREGIETRFIVRDRHAPSGVALIMVGEGGQNLISVAAGSNDRLAKAHIDRAKPAFAGARCCLLQLETPLPTVEAALRLAKREGVTTILDPAPCRRLAKRLLQRVDILTPNESELAALTGLPVKTKRDIERAGEALLQTGVGEVLATCGARGVCRLAKREKRWFPAPKIRAVDTVGAGDCFNGMLAAALSAGLAKEAAIHFAVTAAARSVARPGAQPSFPKLKPSAD